MGAREIRPIENVDRTHALRIHVVFEAGLEGYSAIEFLHPKSRYPNGAHPMRKNIFSILRPGTHGRHAPGVAAPAAAEDPREPAMANTEASGESERPRRSTFVPLPHEQGWTR